MALLDRSGNAVVVRIAYDGPPTSGKTTSLRMLAKSLGQESYTPAEVAGRTVYFDWMEYTGGRFEGCEIRCQVVSVPGQTELTARRRLLLRDADAVIFVGDTSRSGVDESFRCLVGLGELLRAAEGPPIGLILQANKRDLPDAVPLEEVRRHWEEATGPNLAIVPSVASEGVGIRETFVFAVRLALDRVRQLAQQRALPQGAPEVASGPALLEALRLAEEQLSEPELAPTPAEIEASLAGPRLPDSSVPSGWIWPPVDGRITLHEATAGAFSVPRCLPTGDWLAERDQTWTVHSEAQSLFPDSDAGRASLVHWAHAHAVLGARLSGRRCIALVDSGDHYRLWQIVRAEPSLHDWISQAVRALDPRQLVARVAESALTYLEARADWIEALPCGLQTIGRGRGRAVYVGLMPTKPLPIEAAAAPAEALCAELTSALGPDPSPPLRRLIAAVRRHASMPASRRSAWQLERELEAEIHDCWPPLRERSAG